MADAGGDGGEKKGGEGGSSGELSKKQLKKLAKQKEKQAKKDAKKGGGGGGAAGGGAAAAGGAAAGGGSAAPAPTAAPAAVAVDHTKPPPLYLARASADDAATLKASVAAAAFGLTLKPAKKSSNTGGLAAGFLHGPALVVGEGAGCPVAFGGNGIAKALYLMSGGGGGSDGGGDGARLDEVDDLLEFERTELRPALSLEKGDKKRAKKVDAALSKLEGRLGGDGGGSAYLVGGSLTAADVAVVVTLSGADGDEVDAAKYPALAAYLSLRQSSSEYTKGKEAVPSLLPPAPFDFDSDPSLLRAVEAVFATAIESAFPNADELGVPTSVVKCSHLKFGDYQCNAAMQLFSKAKKAGFIPPGINTPQDVAKAIIAAVPEDNPCVDSLSVNGPGFVLCRIKASYLTGHMNALISAGAPPKPIERVGGAKLAEHCVVDFSSPNIAKEMHVGHLRSTIIGESVCRVLEYVGCQVERVNHVGDWGTQFGMLIQYLKEEYPDFHRNHEGAESSISDLTVFYKNAKKRFDESEPFKDASRINVVKLQSGDPECREIWQILCDVSRREFLKVYKRLDITLTEVGESFYNSKIPPVIEEFEGRDMVEVQEGGAKCVFVPGFRVPLMLQKSDGGFGYDSTDMAALKYRLSEVEASRLVYITDFGQGDHFKLCFAAAERIGWLDDDDGSAKEKKRLMHIGFGTVMGEDGKRFKTRSGDTVRLVDLLDEAVGRMEASLRERIAAGGAAITEDEVHETACAMGYGAVKYFDLRRNPTTNYKFSYDQMLDTKGNTAIYLLYAHARLESICAKGKKEHNTDVDELIKGGKGAIVVAHSSERNLAMHLRMFADVVEETLDDLFPYHICDYLYALSIAVSDFVTQCRVLGSPEMESRLLLCRATAIVMRQCFDLLAIRHVMRI